MDLFARFSGYKVNMSKSLIMGLNITSEIKESVTAVTLFPWGSHVKYLEVILIDSLDLATLIDLNLRPIINVVRMQLGQWQKLQLSWFGRVVVLKMKILSRFVFIFRNLILPISQSMLNEIQHFLFGARGS